MSSKSASKAKKTKQAVNNDTAGVGAAQQDCPLVKHFFKIKVEDKDGTPVTTVRPKLELNDGTVVNAAPLDAAGRYDTGKILDLTSPCKVSFPDVYDAEWWPEGERPKGFSVNQQITIADGDCAVKVAFDKGFRDYLTIWSRSKNDALKQQHPNPNALVAGDVLWARQTRRIRTSRRPSIRNGSSSSTWRSPASCASSLWIRKRSR